MTETALSAPNNGRALVDGTVLKLTLGGLLGRRRGLLLLALPAVLLAVAICIRLLVGIDDDAASNTLSSFALGTLLPLIALIAGTGVIAPEIDDGSIIYLLSKPMPRPRIVHSKLMVAVGSTLVFGALPVFVAGLIMAGTQRGYAVAFGLAAALASIAYAAIFLLFGVISRHAVVFGLIYALLWETLVGNYLSGAGFLSVQQWALGVAKATAASGALKAGVGLPTALVMLAVVTVGATWFAGRRLSAFSLVGED
jgi:ABC-2 type transport system permease protein